MTRKTVAFRNFENSPEVELPLKKSAKFSATCDRILKLAGTTDLQAANCADRGKWRGSRGFFVSRKAVVLLLIVYVCSLVATGLLVYYCMPRFSCTQPAATDTNVESMRTTSQVTLSNYETRSSNRLPTNIIPTHYR
jgi:hypothetical protein